MIETYATATDFRKHLAQIANCVAYREDRCVVMRHGQEMVALVSSEDLMFLRKYRPRKIGPPSVDVFSPRAAWRDYFPEPPVPQPPPPSPEEERPHLAEPHEMPLQEVVDIYLEFRDRLNGEGELADWLRRAAILLKKCHIAVPEPTMGPEPAMPS